CPNCRRSKRYGSSSTPNSWAGGSNECCPWPSACSRPTTRRSPPSKERTS
ncbi:LOW QUALITY PROTEIN: formamidopyrimidine-DNA glycosylase, partial [Streptomyces pristinaespiralis ATCC 25486]